MRRRSERKRGNTSGATRLAFHKLSELLYLANTLCTWEDVEHGGKILSVSGRKLSSVDELFAFHRLIINLTYNVSPIALEKWFIYLIKIFF